MRLLWRLIGVTVAAALAAAAAFPASPAAAVIGGVPAGANHPYFVKLQMLFTDGSNLCGGSLIDSSWVLTAAHCFEHDKPYVGTLGTFGSGKRPLGDVAIHPVYNGHATDGHDLALIRVGSGDGVLPVQVGAPSDPGAYAPGTLATIMGHGRTSAGGEPSELLLAVNTRLRSDEYMDGIFNHWYSFDHWPDSLAIGAGARRRTACHGDSGGPLVVYRNDVTVQVGVASFARDSCDTAAGFAELAGPQLAWIASRVPSIMDRWGTCDAGFGTVGEYTARYTTTTFPGAGRDGSYYWSIGCQPLEPPILD